MVISFEFVFLFLINIIKLCIPLPKLDLPTLLHGSREERTQRNKLEIRHSLGLEPRDLAYRADALPTELRCQLTEPEF